MKIAMFTNPKKLLQQTAKITSIILVSLVSFSSFGHAEHDKPRYVSELGFDKGRCDKKSKPCKTIAYAAKNASKGDKILISVGKYEIDSAETLFYLTSDIIPVAASYNQTFTKQQTEKYPTFLAGVPVEYADQLTKAGFQIIVDSKGLEKTSREELAKKLNTIKALSQPQSNEACQNGRAGSFPCKNMDLLSHVPLSAFSNNPSAANDIWGFVDLNDQREYAIMGLRNGVSVIDVTDPENPNIVKTFSSQSTTWRDIKVFQKYDHASQRFKSYAYITADSSSVGLMILDLTQLPDNVTIANFDTTDLSAHNVYLSNVDYTTNTALTNKKPYLHIAGSNRFGGAFNSFDLTDPVNPSQTYVARNSSRSRYTHDASSMIIRDERKDTQCKNGSETCEVFFDFNEQEFFLWDKTRNTSPEQLSSTSYNNASYVHSGWWSEDQLYVLVHDEQDELNHGLNTTVRIFDISDLTNPTLVSIWTGATRAIDHNGFVRGNRYYMSTYERGLVVLDISDPHSPSEVGFFDTFPTSNNTAFNGAWGVYPYLPSGNIIVSDINSGLYVIKDNTLGVSAGGTVGFSSPSYEVDEGATIEVTVHRLGDISKSVSVQYETHTLSASTNDFTMVSGTLTWEANNNDVKIITIPITDDDENSEILEKFLVRLFNPTNGLTLEQTNLAIVDIQADPTVNIDSQFQFTQQGTIDVIEFEDSLILEVSRQGTDSTAQTISFEQSNFNEDNAATEPLDFKLIPSDKQLIWLAGDTSPKHITITLEDDQLSEPTFEKITLSLLHENPERIGANSSFTINIRDDDSNSAPEIIPLTNISQQGAGVVTLAATASDAENDILTYRWNQKSGPTLEITNENSPVATINVTNETVNYTFEIVVKDSLGATSIDELTINVTKEETAVPAPSPVTNTPTGSSSSSGFSPILLLLSFSVLRRRKR